MGTSDFIIVGDCKLSSFDNLLQIIKGKGYFLAPLAMHASVQEELKKHVLELKTSPVSLFIKTKGDSRQEYSGFEMSATLIDPQTQEEYKYRRTYVHSTELESLRIKSLECRAEAVVKDLSEIKESANTKYYGTREKIFAKVEKILGKHDVKEFVAYSITEHAFTTKKKIGKGKPGTNSVQERLKGSLQVFPIWLKLPKHIVAMMFLLLTCAQLFTLIDREAKNTLAANNEKLEGMFPNKIKTASPKTEQILDKFSNVSLVYMVQSEQMTLFSPTLSALQIKLIQIIGVRVEYYDTEYIRKQLETQEIKVLILSTLLNALNLNQKVEK